MSWFIHELGAALGLSDSDEEEEVNHNDMKDANVPPQSPTSQPYKAHSPPRIKPTELKNTNEQRQEKTVITSKTKLKAFSSADDVNSKHTNDSSLQQISFNPHQLENNEVISATTAAINNIIPPDMNSPIEYAPPMSYPGELPITPDSSNPVSSSFDQIDANEDDFDTDYVYRIRKRTNSNGTTSTIIPESSRHSFSNFMWGLLGFSSESPRNSIQVNDQFIDDIPEGIQQPNSRTTTTSSNDGNLNRLIPKFRLTSSDQDSKKRSEKSKSVQSSMNFLAPKRPGQDSVLVSWESLESARKGFSFDDLRPQIKLCHVPENAKTILTKEMAEKFRSHLSPIQRESSKWHFVYSLESSGISMSTLYDNCEDRGPTLWLIRDDQDGLFGAFMSDNICVQPGFFGNGDCFLWKQNEKKELEFYHASGKNDYLIHCEANCIALGGGEGRFGLWIDEELFNGYSEPCHTFDNKPLSSKSEFRIVDLEIWAFEI